MARNERRVILAIRSLTRRSGSATAAKVGALLAGVGLAYALRVRAHTLGDSSKWFAVVDNAIRQYRPFSEIPWHNASLDLPGLEFINFQQALDLTVHVGVYSLLHAFGIDQAKVAYEAVSIVAGGLYLVALWSLSRRLSGSMTDRLAVFGFFASLGTLQLFCGYGESYTLVTLLSVLYLTFAIDSLRGDRPLWHAAAVLGLAGATHMLAVSLAPSFGLLLWRHPRWGSLLRQPRVHVPLCLVGLVVSAVAYGQFYHGLQLPLVTPDQPGRHAMLSLRHAATLGNALLLTGPFGLIWGLTALVKRRPSSPERRFLGVAAGGACLLIGVHDITLGGRDWDLMSFPALMLASWGIVSLRDLLAGDTTRALARVVVPVMALHTLLWIGINADEDRALTRLENLLQYANQPPHYRYWTLGYYYTNVLDQHYDRAVHYFTRAIAAAPEDQLLERGRRPYSYRKFLAIALARDGQFEACVEEARAIYAAQSEPMLDINDLAVQEEYAKSLLKLAQRADDEGDSSAALIYWRESLTPLKVVSYETEDPLTFWNLSAAHRRLGNHEQSILDFRRSLGMSEDPEGDMIALGDLYLQEGEKELAATAYAQLLIPTVGGVTSDGFKRVGIRLYKVGHLSESSIAYEAAIAVDSLNHMARMNLAWNRYLQNRFDEAIRQYQLVIAQRETSEAAFGLSLAYLHAGHLDSARVAYSRAVEHFGADDGRRVMADENLRRFVGRGIQPQAAAEILEAYWPR